MSDIDITNITYHTHFKLLPLTRTHKSHPFLDVLDNCIEYILEYILGHGNLWGFPINICVENQSTFRLQINVINFINQ